MTEPSELTDLCPAQLPPRTGCQCSPGPLPMGKAGQPPKSRHPKAKQQGPAQAGRVASRAPWEAATVLHPPLPICSGPTALLRHPSSHLHPSPPCPGHTGPAANTPIPPALLSPGHTAHLPKRQLIPQGHHHGHCETPREDMGRGSPHQPLLMSQAQC